MMIDPDDITKFDRSQIELEEFAIFAVLVAGKTAKTIAPRLENFLSRRYDSTPLQYIHELGLPGTIRYLQMLGIGCYNQKGETLWQLALQNPDLKNCTPDILEKIKGISFKTSRFFILHSRPNQQYAALDTHILKGLRDFGIENVPKNTPGSRKQYERLENNFLSIAKQQGKTPAELDLEWWIKYSKRV